MSDILAVVLTIAFFVISLIYSLALDRYWERL